MRPILETCPFQMTNFNTEKQKMETVQFFNFLNFIIILTNPYVDYANSNYENRTIVRKTVQYGTVFNRYNPTQLKKIQRIRCKKLRKSQICFYQGNLYTINAIHLGRCGVKKIP